MLKQKDKSLRSFFLLEITEYTFDRNTSCFSKRLADSVFPAPLSPEMTMA